MVVASSRLAHWFHEHRAQYNRWAGRHTILIWCTVAALLAFLLIVIAARSSHPLPQLPDVSGTPFSQPGRLT
jgi:hypothetical protein